MFFTFLIGSLLFFLVFVSLLGFYINKIAGVAVTSKFRAAEAIANGTVPEQWVTQINRRVAGKSLARVFARSISPEELLIQKLDNLRRYFETCPFFESPEARTLLLDELDEDRRQIRFLKRIDELEREKEIDYYLNGPEYIDSWEVNSYLAKREKEIRMNEEQSDYSDSEELSD